MAKLEFVVLIVFFILSLVINNVFTLKCWTCSSETEGYDQWCNNNLDQSKIPIEVSNANILYRECNNTVPKGQEMIQPVCRKDVHEVDGKYIFNRHCHFMDSREPLEKCATEKTRANGNKVFCADCRTDGCNNTNGIAPIFLLILGSAFLIKFLPI